MNDKEIAIHMLRDSARAIAELKMTFKRVESQLVSIDNQLEVANQLLGGEMTLEKLS
jgi:hypothetical protein